MDISQMIYAHSKTKADVTVAVLPVQKNEASGFGVVDVDNKNRVTGFTEKPVHPKILKGTKNMVLVSIGNYIFNTEALVKIINAYPKEYSEHDFGKNIMPKIFTTYRTYAYSLSENIIPGLKKYELKGYWRDAGTILSYWRAHMDLLSEEPLLNLDNPLWPIHSGRHEGPPSHIVSGQVEDCMFGGGCQIHDAVVKKCVFGRNVIVEKGAVVEESIVMDGTIIGAGAKIYKTIIDRFNVIPKGSFIGKGRGIECGAYAGEAGIMVIPRAKHGQ
jgi:glucose-1-phosphate adenylyltransferase